MIEQSKLYDIIKKPLFTEKGTGLRETQKKVAIEVCPSANKDQIKRAVKAMFDVDVLGVSTLNYRGKKKRVKQHIGKRKNFKKAYLTLRKGTDVDLFGIVGQESVPEEEKSQ